MLDVSELMAILYELNPDISQTEMNEMVTACDRDGGGTVDYEEFIRQIIVYLYLTHLIFNEFNSFNL